MKPAASRRTAVVEEGYSPFTSSTCNTPEENQTSAQSLSNAPLFYYAWSACGPSGSFIEYYDQV